MDLIRTFVDFVLHLDTHLAALVDSAGAWSYVVLAAIIFAETGLVVAPILPGDSLLFAAGALAAASSLNVWVLFVVLSICAIVGDAVNYWVGSRIGAQAAAGKIPYIRREYIEQTHAFYERHGGKTIIMARFVPIVRTFAPFVAGAGSMTYQRFALYNVVGGIAWVASMLFAGFFFGNIPIVRENFSLVVLGIIGISILPGIVAFLQERSRQARERAAR